ncbi:MAG: DUF1579 family protein [Planctomycetes bacterium]|nr:DUF1579 family protein [Planctomycetota bacterium]
MEMPGPNEFHRALDVLVGRWVGKEQMHPSPWSPEGHVAEAEIDNRAALGGFAVIQDYRQSMGGVTTYEGHGVLSHDASSGLYRMHWWDSMGTPCNVFSGGFEGDRLRLVGENPTVKSRTTFELAEAAAGRYSFVMEVSLDGENWASFMEGDYRREG